MPIEPPMPDSLLANHRAIITGASSGIGEAIALAFAQAGASVIVNYRSHPEQADRVAKYIAGRGGKAFAVQADVSKLDDCKRLFEEAQRHMGGVDILVANAGMQRDAAFTDMTLD